MYNTIVGNLGYAYILCFTLLSACASVPSNVNQICEIFTEEPDWFDETYAVEKKWGVPISVQMAIVRQESGFQDQARPPRKKLLGFIPTFRPSSAYGYAQAIDGTWEKYQKQTGNQRADRDDFADAVDFIGWYVQESHVRLNIPKTDARRQYLAYHEGQGGYARGSHRQKKWLLAVAKKVARQAEQYRRQLQPCRAAFEDRSGWWWPF